MSNLKVTNLKPKGVVVDIKPLMAKVDNIIPRGMVNDTKPFMDKVLNIKPFMSKMNDKINQMYYEPDTTLARGQSMGLLLALTYPVDYPNTTQIRT